MRAVLGFLTLCLYAQVTFGQIQVSFEGVRHLSEEDAHAVKFADVTPASTAVSNMHQSDGEREGGRELQSSLIKALIKIIKGIIDAILRMKITITLPDGDKVEIEISAEGDSNGESTTIIEIDPKFLNANKTSICEGCEITVELGECIAVAQQCDDYDKVTTNNALGVSLCGDPHMVGLLGQKIDWFGVDNAWYCLLSDGPDFQVNVRLSAPMPEEFPDRQLISAVSVLSNDGRSSLVIEVKDPYATITDGCPDISSMPCLADGGLRILVGGEESAAMQAPIQNARLPGSSPVVVSTANLPVECRPFGGDRIWATQFAERTTKTRRLRSTSISFAQWVLQPDTLAAPTWCAKFLKETNEASLLSTYGRHATFRVETPVAAVRVNAGVNYQDLATAPDGTVLVPDLEFWQMDLGFDDLRLSSNVTGLMGDTSRFVLDDEGMPVTSGLGALHGPVDSYRVSGPFDRDFKKLHG